MSIIIKNPADGTDISVNVEVTGAGFVDAILRADSREVFQAAALANGILLEVDGELIAAPGVNIDEIGPFEIARAIYDEDGETIITPALWDTRHHVNLRLGQPALSNHTDGVLNWQSTAILWHGGDTDVQVNANEQAVCLNGVSLVDADTIETKGRVWL